MIGPLATKNRVIMGPLGTNYGTTDGYSTDRDKSYYAERAKGGVGMIITEAMNISAAARNHRNSLCVFHDRFIPGLHAVVRAIKDHGALVVAQLNHRGILLRRSVLGMEPVGPSDGINPATGERARGLSVEEIVDIQKEFLSAATRLWRAGYDAIELHAANGYLFQQFFTERHNRRTDAYGGSVENRMRLLLETVGRIRDALPDFPVFVRISATEYVDGGYGAEEVVALAVALEKTGVAAIDLSGGSNETPELSRFCIQPPSFPRRCLEPYARPIKDAVSIPVIMAGRIATPEDAEAVLLAGSADYIAICRGLVADPHWCQKAFGEVNAPIRPCIYCNVCYERLSRELDVACVQNPMVGTEFESLEYMEPQLFRPSWNGGAKPKRILVIGGGVAGAEAARIAAANGHQVEIWEKEDKPGGQVPLAIAAPHKTEVEAVWTYRRDALAALKVPLRTGYDATAQRIKEYDPDLVMISTGSSPRDIELPGAGDRKILQAWDVLGDPSVLPAGSQVTVIGGGMVGIELVDLLVAQGCTATVIELTSSVATEMARNNRLDILLRLEGSGVTIMTESKVRRIEGDEMVVGTPDGEVRVALEGPIVLAVGPVPNREVVPVVEGLGLPYVLIGDCNEPGDFLTGIRDASLAALAIDDLRTDPREEMQP